MRMKENEKLIEEELKEQNMALGWTQQNKQAVNNKNHGAWMQRCDYRSDMETRWAQSG